MADKKRRDKGDGCISQRTDGTWTARIRVGLTPEGKPKIKAFYGKSEREVKKKLKEFEKEMHKNDISVVQRGTVESYMLNWLRSVKSNELKPKSYDRLEQTLTYQVIPHIGHLQVAAIQPDDVQKMVNSLKNEGLSYGLLSFPLVYLTMFTIHLEDVVYFLGTIILLTKMRNPVSSLWSLLRVYRLRSSRSSIFQPFSVFLRPKWGAKFE